MIIFYVTLHNLCQSTVGLCNLITEVSPLIENRRYDLPSALFVSVATERSMARN